MYWPVRKRQIHNKTWRSKIYIDGKFAGRGKAPGRLPYKALTSTQKCLIQLGSAKWKVLSMVWKSTTNAKTTFKNRKSFT